MDSLSIGEQGLELAHTLWEIRDEPDLDVDMVDGAFYWMVCNGEVFDRLQSWDENADQDGSEIRALYELSSRLPGAAEVLDMNVYPSMRGSIFQWSGSSIPVNAPTFSGEKTIGLGYWLALGVTSSAWRGERVEAVARERLAWARNVSPKTFENLEAGGFHFTGIDLQFHRPNSLLLFDPSEVHPAVKSERWYLESPVVTCTIHFPFPPEGLIGATYDAVAIRLQKWNTRLYGYGVKQEQTVGVAIRTWAIGLLVGCGVPFREAAQRVYEALQIHGFLESSQWWVDRTNLVDRVPEASATSRRSSPRCPS